MSHDGYSFVVQRQVAMGSGTLRGMLDSEDQFDDRLRMSC